MTKIKVSVVSDFEARTAALLVQRASSFSSSIKLEIDNKIINAKSIMGVMSLNLSDDKEIKLIIDGSDEEKVISSLEDIFRVDY